MLFNKTGFSENPNCTSSKSCDFAGSDGNTERHVSLEVLRGLVTLACS